MRKFRIPEFAMDEGFANVPESTTLGLLRLGSKRALSPSIGFLRLIRRALDISLPDLDLAHAHWYRV